VTAEKSERREQEILKPEELFRTIDEVRRDAPPLEPLWGDFLFKKAVTSIVGDPGIGKTGLGYGLASALCLQQPFLGIEPEEVINALYLDFESADPLISSRANYIIGEKEIPNLYIYNDIRFFLNQIAKITIDICHEKFINLLIIDNQTSAFNTRDENDNSEAARQMRFVRQITNACNTATLIFHHTSKSNLPGIRKGTGAFARARLADVCINIDYPDEEHSEIIRWQVPKNRLVDSQPLWYIKKTGGTFDFTDPPLGVVGRTRVNTIIYKVQQEILALLNNGQQYKRKDILEILSQFEPRMVDEGLDRLKRLGRLEMPQYGFYKARKVKCL